MPLGGWGKRAFCGLLGLAALAAATIHRDNVLRPFFAFPLNGSSVSSGDRLPIVLSAGPWGRRRLAEAVAAGRSPVVCIAALGQSSCARLEHAADLSFHGVPSGRHLLELSAHIPVSMDALQRVSGAFAGQAVVPLERVQHLLAAPESERQVVKVAEDAVVITVVNRTACRFGELPCMTPAIDRPHCGSIETFRFMLYPEDDAKRSAADDAAATQGVHTPRAAHSSLMRLLLTHPLRTTNPAEACVRVPAVNTICAPSGCSSRSVQAAALARLAGWQDGRDGLVWELSDHQTMSETGLAVRAKSSFGPPWDIQAAVRMSLLSQAWSNVPLLNVPNHEPLNEGFDVAVPLTFYRCSRPLFAHLRRPEAGPNGRPRSPSWAQRDVLASFVGGLYGLEAVGHPSGVRMKLARMADALELEQHSVGASAAGDGGIPANLPLPVVVRGACDIRNTPQCDGEVSTIQIATDPQCDRWQARIDAEAIAQRRRRALDSGADRDKFDALNRRSRFAFAPPGEGTHSYRLLEALREGAVPVMLCSAALPFDDIIDWSRVAVVHSGDCSEGGLRRLVDRLSAVSRDDWEAMQAAGREAFERYLATPQRHVDATFVTLAKRFRAAIARQGGQALLKGDAAAEVVAGETLLSRSAWATTRRLELPRPVPLVLRPEAHFDRDAPGEDASAAHSAAPVARGPSAVPRELLWAADPENTLATCTAIRDLLPSHLVPTRVQGPALTSSLLVHLPSTEATNPLKSLCQGMGPRQGLRSEAWFAALHSFMDLRSAHDAFERSERGGSTQATMALRDAFGEVAVTTARLLVKAVQVCAPTAADRALNYAPVAALMFLAGDAFHVGCKPREALTAMHAALVIAAMPKPQPTAVESWDAFDKESLDALQRQRDVPVLDADLPGPPHESKPWVDVTNVVSAVRLTTASLHALLRASAAAVWERGAVFSAAWWAPRRVHGSVPLPALLDLAESEQGWGAGEATPVAGEGWDELAASEAAGRILPVLPEPRLAWPAGTSRRSGFESSWARLQRSVGSNEPGWDPAAAWIAASRAAHLARGEQIPSASAACLLEGTCSMVAPPPPQARWPAARVAIVTMCAYNTTTTSITSRSMANRLAYCSRHGYHCVLETSRQLDSSWPPAWDKVELLRRHQGAADWVAWVDCDTFFTNFSLPLEGVLARAGVLGSPDDADTAAGDADDATSAVLVASEDGASLNTGVMMLRSCPEGARLLDEVWESAQSAFLRHQWWEQAAFIDALTLGRAASELDGRVVMVPQGAINSYSPELAAMFCWEYRPLHAVWRRGDLAVSFSGCANLIGSSESCEALLSAADSEWRLAQRAD